MADLFQSKVPEAIEASVKDAKADLESDRITEMENRLAAYEDDGAGLVGEVLSKILSSSSFDIVSPHIDISQNLLRRIVDEISSIYNVEAARTLYNEEGHTVDNDRWDEIQEEIPFDIQMQQVNRLTNLCNETAVVVVPRRGKLCLDILAASEFAISTDEDDPTRPIAFMYELSRADRVDDKDRQFVYYDIIDEGHHYVLDQDGKIIGPEGGTGENPYKDEDGEPVLPAAFFHRSFPRNSFWQRTQGSDLYNAYLQIGILLTWLNFLVFTQSFKQIYASNADIPEDQILNPLTPIIMYNDGPGSEGNPQIGTLDLSTDPTRLLAVIERKIAFVANNWGLSMENFTMSGDKSSGLALQLSNVFLQELRKKQVPLYKQWEMALFKTIQIVNNTMAAENGWDEIPDGLSMRLDPGETDMNADPMADYELFRKQMNDGLASQVDWLLDQNPDLTEEEAIHRLMKIAEIRRKIKTEIMPEQAALQDALIRRGAPPPGNAPPQDNKNMGGRMMDEEDEPEQ